MKRFHVHVHVEDLARSIGFYTKLFGAEPTCCYARSTKHWVTDPQGIAWEHFHTLGEIPVFSQGPQADAAAACCTQAGAGAAASAQAPAPDAPTPRGKPVGIPVKASGSCC